MKKTVLHFLYGMNCGGLERRACRTMLALHQRHPELDLHVAVAYGEVFYPELLAPDSGVTVHLLHGSGNREVFRKFRALLQDLKPYAVQCWTIKEAAMAALLKPFFHYTLVASYVANVFGKPRGHYRWFYWITEKMADCIVSNSRAGLTAYQVPPALAVHVPNCCECRNPDPEAVARVREEFGLAGKKVVVSVANLQQNKDHETFLTVALQIVRQDPGVVFLAVGSGKLLETYRNRVPEALRRNVIFTGARKDTDALVEAADVGMLCSFTEGISNAILEYMAHGKPVIATGGGGLAETILDGQTGRLFPAGDAAAMASALREMLDDPARSAAWGEYGRQLIRTEYTPEKTADSYYNLYKYGRNGR